MKSLSRRQALGAAGVVTLATSFSSIARAATQKSFTVTIRNVATDKTLMLPDGKTSSAPIAPGVYVVASRPNVLFTPGGYADEALERLAEDGNFQPMLDKVSALKNLAASGMFIPGQPFIVTASPGDRLQFATMFVQSNDLFFAPSDGGIALFDAGGRAMRGNLTSRVALFDAGTEINQAQGPARIRRPANLSPTRVPSSACPSISS